MAKDGGYTSVHTDVNMVYDATANAFLPGNNVALTDQATQCLTSFSLDFEQQSQNASDGPNMTGLPNKSAACQSLLSQFFAEWFDTAYPSGTATEPDITGPG